MSRMSDVIFDEFAIVQSFGHESQLETSLLFIKWGEFSLVSVQKFSRSLSVCAVEA